MAQAVAGGHRPFAGWNFFRAKTRLHRRPRVRSPSRECRTCAVNTARKTTAKHAPEHGPESTLTDNRNPYDTQKLSRILKARNQRGRRAVQKRAACMRASAPSNHRTVLWKVKSGHLMQFRKLGGPKRNP
eukprot:scaffold94267_cov63-Phaeocystis_antarctica.AAC.1